MALHPHPSLSRNTVEPTVKVTTTLKNNSAASHDYALVRYADIDANNAHGGDFNNLFDFGDDSAWGVQQRLQHRVRSDAIRSPDEHVSLRVRPERSQWT